MANKNIPQIRFKGFDGEWEEQELCDTSVCSIDTGCPFDSKDFDENGKYLVITNGNIQDDTTFVNSNDCNRITIDEKSSYHLKKGEILITMDGTVGRSAIVNDYGMVLAQRVGRLKPIINGYFLYYLLNTGNFSKTMIAIGHGGTIKHISLDEIGSYKLRVAKSDKEQTRIASLFTSLDKQISCSEAKMEKLRTVKKTLLKKMFASQGEKTPQIRFKGFEGEWEEKSFAEIFDVYANIALSRSQLDKNGGKVQSIHYGDILIKYGSILNAEINTIPYINQDVDLKFSLQNKVNNGDIIIADAAEDSTVGKCVEVENIGDKIILSGLHTIPCRPKIKFGNGFMGHYMNSSAYHSTLLQIMQGTKVSSISKKAISKTNLKYAKSLAEQSKIASLFTSLDKQIRVQEAKTEKLKAIKKTLLKKMFV